MTASRGAAGAAGRGRRHPSAGGACQVLWERVLLGVGGLLRGSVTMLNSRGVTRFRDLSVTVFGLQIPRRLAVGVLP